MALLAVAAAAACSDGNGRNPSSSVLTRTPPAAATVAARATPTPAPAPQQPAGTHTGVAELDAAIDALLARDDSAVEALTLFRIFPCVAVQRGPGDTPACPPGIADGTPVEAVADDFCEGALIPRALFTGFTERRLPAGAGLYAVYSAPSDNAAARVYSIVFAIPDTGAAPDSALVAEVQGGLIARFRRTCSFEDPRAFWDAAQALPGFETVLAPLNDKP